MGREREREVGLILLQISKAPCELATMITMSYVKMGNGINIIWKKMIFLLQKLQYYNNHCFIIMYFRFNLNIIWLVNNNFIFLIEKFILGN